MSSEAIVEQSDPPYLPEHIFVGIDSWLDEKNVCTLERFSQHLLRPSPFGFCKRRLVLKWPNYKLQSFPEKSRSCPSLWIFPRLPTSEELRYHLLLAV